MSLQDKIFDAPCITPTAHGKQSAANSRRGSALLIVLGMLAFMIVSAVAFAAYMRFSRLPSSYLRRTSASRQLVKAALARAIDEIDASIGKNPHPGVGIEKTRYPRNTNADYGSVGTLEERNIWFHRVFFGSGDALATDETVSPLSLEALAYIPPAFVNEARYFSRFSPAARWKSLGFDAGRYAFCALDVSDCFDINRMSASAPRSSAGNRRVNLGYIFENDAHTAPATDAKNWDDWMKEYRTVNDDSELEWSGSVAPFVSVADFNLALGWKGGIGNIKSPFFKFIDNGDSPSFYDASGNADLERLSRMTFVTDGLFPPEDETGMAENEKTRELANPEWQPFRMNPNGGRVPPISELLMGSAHEHESEMGWHRRLGGVGLAALYDYLDPDHVPVSLAVPTTERVPMICGVEPAISGARLKITRTLEYTNNNGQDGNGDPAKPGSANDAPRKVEQIVHYRIDPDSLDLMGGAVNAVYAYPFSRDAGYSEKFKLDGRLSYFFSTEQMGLRTNNSNPNNEVLHIADSGTITSGVDANGLMNIALAANLQVDTQNAPKDENGAVKDITMPFMASGAQQLGLRLKNESKFLSVKYVWEQSPVQNGYAAGGLPSYDWGPKFSEMLERNDGWAEEPKYTSDLCIVNGKGVREQNLKKLADNGTSLYLNLAVWLRIKNGDDKIVDMVPACLRDDSVANNAREPEAFPDGGEFGRYYPLLRFDTAGKNACVQIPLSPVELEKLAKGDTQPPEITIWPKSAIVADPRFNHAPENWFALGSALITQAWITNNHATDNERDGDIFMDVSDQAYLQSKYELAMLPACATLKNEGQPTGLGRMPHYTSYGENSIPEEFDRTVHRNFMWKTYDPIDFVDEFASMNWVGDSKGYRINPYSDSTNVVMAALANTPLNWACAGTNDVEDAVNFNYSDPANPDGAGFNRLYAWNAYNSKAKLMWSDLQNFAGTFMRKVREHNGDWEGAWDDMGWYDDADMFCGSPLSGEASDIWNVDRKFFYGYWKECFAAKQQLFLVFVRAEPVMMGGGGMGQIPPQLGARAVALVWRNPSNFNRKGEELQDGEPHQTRILFYRQLD